MSDLTIEQQTSQFMVQLGEPALVFMAPADTVTIPSGILSCCRVSHQVACANHIAYSLVGAETVMTYPTGETVEMIHPRPVSALGDILAEPTALFAATRAHWMMAEATAKRRSATVKTMQVAVFLLTPEQAQAWKRLEERIEAYAEHLRIDLSVEERIPLLPFAVFPDPAGLDEEGAEEVQAALRTLRESTDWCGLDTYPQTVTVWPGEIGHDGATRYLLGEVTQPEFEGIPWMGDPNDPIARALALGDGA